MSYCAIINILTYSFLFNDLGVELEVDVVHPLEVDPAKLGGGSLLQFQEFLSGLEDGDHPGLVSKPFDILVGMCVATLQHLLS